MELLQNQLDKLNVLGTISNEDEEVVINGFMDRYSVNEDEAREIFNETKKFLALAVEADEKDGEGVFIDQPLLIIDEMWHTFILHTKQYVNFCYTQFNRFVHHRPTPAMEKQELKKKMEQNPSLVLEETKRKLEKQYSLIYEKYGPETLVKWYDEWPSKYTPEYLSKIKKTS